ncbi:MAG: hypothetical protein GY701_28740 [Sulfitobacter sp.]|nr:hypothetical protein [Sulfitobacter sp.]
MNIGSAKGVYERLSQLREPFVRRAREAARLTIPDVVPEGAGTDMQSTGEDLPEPYQSIGARGSLNLKSKLMLSLFPVNTNFFRMAMDEAAIQEVESFDEAARQEVEETLAAIEDAIIGRFEAMRLRIKISEAMESVVIAGNSLLHVPADRMPRVFRLDCYVVERDPRDHLLTLVIRERVSPTVLDAKLRARLIALGVKHNQSQNWIEVYTVLRREPNGNAGWVWKEWQEIDGKKLGVVTEHASDRNPYLPLRMYTSDGEAYGRSHVERYMGDLRAVDVLSQALQDGAAAASKILMLTDPAGMTRISKLARAKNGTFVPGREQDVHPLQLNKHADFAFARQEKQDLKRDLGMAFLLNSTVPRQAERVTAEEIRLVASELDSTLGNVYSVMSSDLQLPMVKILLGNMSDTGALDHILQGGPLPDEVKPVIVTGLEAIGRGHDLQRLDEFVAGAREILGPEALSVMNIDVYLRERATALGVNRNVVKSEEQLAAAQQQQKAAMAFDKLAAPIAGKLSPEQLSEAAEQFATQQPAA